MNRPNQEDPVDASLPPRDALAPRLAAYLRPVGSLRFGVYRLYWASMFLAFAAIQMQMMARTWYVYELTGRASLIGVLNLAFAIPMLTLSLFGGALADRLAKRSLLLFSNVLLAVMGVGVAVLISVDAINWWQLALAGALNGTAMAFMGPARQAIIPELVDRPYLLNAISLGNAQMNLTRIAAPGVAGLLIPAMGVEAVFWLMALLAAGAFTLNLFLPRTTPAAPAQRRDLPKEIGRGLGYVRERPLIRDLLIFAFIASIFGFPINLILPVFAEDVLRVGPEGLGLLISAMGAGALVGSMFIASIGDYRRKGLLMVLFTITMGTGIVLFTLTNTFFLAMAALSVVGVGQAARMALNQTLVQTIAEPQMRGRVMSLYQMEIGLQPLGVMPISAASEVVGAPLAMGTSGGIVLAYALISLGFQRSIRRLP